MRIIFSIILSINICNVFAFSNNTKEQFVEKIIQLDFENANLIAKNLDKKTELPYFSYISSLLFNKGQFPLKDKLILEAILKKKELQNNYLNEFIEGLYYLYNNPSNQLAFEKLRHTLTIAKEKKDKSILKLCYLSILELYAHEIVQSSDEYFNYLIEFKSITQNLYETASYEIHLIRYFSKSSKDESMATFNNKFKDFEAFILKNEHQLNSKIKVYYHFFKGLYNKVNNNYNLAKSSYLKTIKLTNKQPYFNYLIYGSYIHLCEIESELGNLNDAKKYLEEAKQFWNKSDTIRSRFIQNRFAAIYYYEKNNEYNTAYKLLKNSIIDEVQLDYRKNTLKISEVNIKLKTAEKEKQIILEQQQKRKNRNIAIGLGGALTLGSIIAFLLFKNTKRKQLLAEKDKFLETQKVATLLKEQELMAIDAMIEGQEKERQRMANDLHDDLGGLMATVKLHFNMLKEKHSSKLYEKTDNLLEEAYQKIRRIAHAKNSGVFAKQGLLKAVKEMARTVSSSNKINIEVIDYGLDERLENSLELTIFRVIQELITNVIKHAFATEVTIHLTNHDDSLNIMIEDNGKGFNPEKIAKTSGMGIHSIDKRIENLGGTVTIESELNKGTTVIIEIPS